MHGFDYSVPLFVTRIRGTRIVVTPNIVSEVFHFPRVAHPNYPSCEHLRTVSKDELISSFCECPSDWGDRQFTSCTAFAEGPRFINMVMTFVLHPLEHLQQSSSLYFFSKKVTIHTKKPLKQPFHLQIFFFRFATVALQAWRATVAYAKNISPQNNTG